MLSVFGSPLLAAALGDLCFHGTFCGRQLDPIQRDIVLLLILLHYRLEKKDRQYQVEEYGYE